MASLMIYHLLLAVAGLQWPTPACNGSRPEPRLGSAGRLGILGNVGIVERKKSPTRRSKTAPVYLSRRKFIFRIIAVYKSYFNCSNDFNRGRARVFR